MSINYIPGEYLKPLANESDSIADEEMGHTDSMGIKRIYVIVNGERVQISTVITLYFVYMYIIHYIWHIWTPDIFKTIHY